MIGCKTFGVLRDLREETMRIPTIQGVIKRRLLVNFRIDPEVLSPHLPEPFRPKLQRGFAVAGICLIRLEEVRPRFAPSFVGMVSENAAHRVAVTWGEGHEGVYIPRRDTDSRFNAAVGGRLFPGEHHLARFEVSDEGGRVSVSMASVDGSAHVSVSAVETHVLPDTSIFSSLEESSAFFERGALGYSATGDAGRFDGLVLDTDRWRVAPLAIESVTSSYFEDRSKFPEGSVTFDHALIMRDIAHRWLAAPDLYGPEAVKAEG